MIRFARWAVLACAVAGALVLSSGAYHYASQAWQGVVDYRSPYLAHSLPASAETTPVSSRVVLVIIDGLRLDSSREMSTLGALREYGADLELTAPQPSLSYPNWTTILTGTTQDYHGVVTNWFEGPVGAETLLDTAKRSSAPYVVVGPSDIATLYPAARAADASYFEPWSDAYLSGRYVDKTIELTARHDPRLVILHLPDVDEAGHDFGGDSDQYRATVARVDGDLRRLVEKLQDDRTTFVVVADHGHRAAGGHGGWEPEVVTVPCVIAGPRVRVSEGEALQEDVAPTVAVMAGLPVPRDATGHPYAAAFGPQAARALEAARVQRHGAIASHIRVITTPLSGPDASVELPADASNDDMTRALGSARVKRLASDREARSFGLGFWLIVGALASLVIVGAASWRALVAAACGSAAYYAVYNALFFIVHGNRWSLSAFNSEDLMDAWMNTRLLEAVIAGLVAAAVASVVYPYLRRSPKGPRGRYLAGWLTLGPVTVVVAQLTLALQVGWFEMGWGITPTWRLPDLLWGFKFDLDLGQATALGAAAVVAPVVSYLIGRYHPKTRISIAEEAQ